MNNVVKKLLEDDAPLLGPDSPFAVAGITKVETVEDLRKFYQFLLDMGISFHHDSSGDDYTNADGSQVFAPEMAAEYDELMGQAFQNLPNQVCSLGADMLAAKIKGEL